MAFDETTSKIKFNVKIPTDTYFAIAYGTDMLGVDMVSFHGRPNDNVLDLYAYFYGEPTVDDQNDYECSSSEAGGWWTFECYRGLQTSDPNDQDYQYTKCHENMEMSWVGLTTTADMEKHDINNFFTFSLPQNCFENVDSNNIYYEESSSYLKLSTLSAVALGYLML